VAIFFETNIAGFFLPEHVGKVGGFSYFFNHREAIYIAMEAKIELNIFKDNFSCLINYRLDFVMQTIFNGGIHFLIQSLCIFCYIK
jgi:hypothetical protein